MTKPLASPRRIVIFSGPNVRASAIESIEALAAAMPTARFLIIAGGIQTPAIAYLKNKIRRLQREPISYPLELLHALASRLRLPKSRRVKGHISELSVEALPNAEFQRFKNIHADACLKAVDEFAPWLGIALGAPILKPALISIPEAGTINVHKSLLPNYRGMPPAFWELKDSLSETGVSVHWVEESLDTGKIIRQSRIPIEPFQTIGGLQTRLDIVANELLACAVKDIDTGITNPAPQTKPTTPINKRPPFLLDRLVRRQLERRRHTRKGVAIAIRDVIKGTALRFYVHLWAPLRNLTHRVTGNCHTSILLYHRVSESFVDSVTVGVEQFDRQIRMLKRHYDVLSLETFLETRGKPRRRPAIVLTFDDGYADNHLAARLLRREGVPCTFFICTRIVNSDDRFPQDIEKKVYGAPALSWHQVKEMAGWGFGFGNHTANHQNVANTDHESAIDQIRTAASDLDDRLSSSGAERLFAYPNGREKDITERIRSELPNEGIDYCFSAYGGVNPPDFDPWDIKRQGIATNVSDIALRAIVEGWQVR